MTRAFQVWRCLKAHKLLWSQLFVECIALAEFSCLRARFVSGTMVFTLRIPQHCTLEGRRVGRHGLLLHQRRKHRASVETFSVRGRSHPLLNGIYDRCIIIYIYVCHYVCIPFLDPFGNQAWLATVARKSLINKVFFGRIIYQWATFHSYVQGAGSPNISRR
jgi:hypothetical protein